MIDEQWLHDAINRAARNIANQRKFHGHVEADDLHQELWLWALKPGTQNKFKRWRDTNDDNGFAKVTNATVHNQALRLARQTKAKNLGHDLADEFFYTKEMLERLLPFVYNKAEWVAAPKTTDENAGRGSKSPAEGNEWLATLVDVDSAVRRLDPGDQALLFEVYALGVSSAQLAEVLDVTRRGVDHKRDAALKRLWDLLGGPKWMRVEDAPGVEEPIGSRRVVSNAQARAMTSEAVDG